MPEGVGGTASPEEITTASSRGGRHTLSLRCEHTRGYANCSITVRYQGEPMLILARMRLRGPPTHSRILSNSLLAQCQGLGEATSQSIRIPHPCGERGEPVAEVVALAHGKAPLEYRNGLRESALTEGQLTHPKGGYSKVEGTLSRFRQTEDVCTHSMPFGKGAYLRETHE